MEFSLNSPILFAIVGAILLLVTAQSVFFLVRAWKAGVEMGIAKSKLRKTVISSAIFTVAPAVSILMGVIVLSKKLGLAFCMGLRSEAAALNKILEFHGFEVVSAICKMGCVDKAFVNIKEEEKIRCGHETMCNPIAQAYALNDAKVDFNLMLGLCVGHDSLFIKYAEAPVTVIAVKDRLLGHNPLAALYSGYYDYLGKYNK